MDYLSEAGRLAKSRHCVTQVINGPLHEKGKIGRKIGKQFPVSITRGFLCKITRVV